MLGKRTLFSWRDSPPQRPAPEGTPLWDEQNEEYKAIRWTDNLCKIITNVPAMRGMLGSSQKLSDITISFVEDDPAARLAYYDIENNAIVLNAAKVKEYSREGEHEVSDLKLNCIFRILHELRHPYQSSHKFDPWLKTVAAENPQLVSVYDSLVREADATAFALTGMYEIVSDPEIFGFDPDAFHGMMDRIPESASRDAFLDSIQDSVENFYTGAAQQAAFAAYFSQGNAPCIAAYVEDAIRSAQYDGLLYGTGGRISKAFQSAAGQDVFVNTYRFLSGMPSIERDDPAPIQRRGYLNPWPIQTPDLLTAITPEQFTKMGFVPG